MQCVGLRKSSGGSGDGIWPSLPKSFMLLQFIVCHEVWTKPMTRVIKSDWLQYRNFHRTPQVCFNFPAQCFHLTVEKVLWPTTKAKSYNVLKGFNLSAPFSMCLYAVNYSGNALAFLATDIPPLQFANPRPSLWTLKKEKGILNTRRSLQTPEESETMFVAPYGS